MYMKIEEIFFQLFQYCRDGQSEERAKFSTVGIPGDYWFCLKFRFGVRSAYPIFAFRSVQWCNTTEIIRGVEKLN